MKQQSQHTHVGAIPCGCPFAQNKHNVETLHAMSFKHATSFKYKQAEGIVIDSTTSMQLLNIALDHSFLYPDAVFTARAMLGIDVDESEVLEIQTKEEKPLPNDKNYELQITNYEFSIFPNPSDGEIIVEYTGDSLCNATFELYNIYGVKLLEEKINSKQQRIILKSINEGVYFYRIINCNAIVNRNKLIITK